MFKIDGVSILHGNGCMFFEGSPFEKYRKEEFLAKKVYQTFLNFDMSKQLPKTLPAELKKNKKIRNMVRGDVKRLKVYR